MTDAPFSNAEEDDVLLVSALTTNFSDSHCSDTPMLEMGWNVINGGEPTMPEIDGIEPTMDEINKLGLDSILNIMMVGGEDGTFNHMGQFGNDTLMIPDLLATNHQGTSMTHVFEGIVDEVTPTIHDLIKTFDECKDSIEGLEESLAPLTGDKTFEKITHTEPRVEIGTRKPMYRRYQNNRYEHLKTKIQSLELGNISERTFNELARLVNFRFEIELNKYVGKTPRYVYQYKEFTFTSLKSANQFVRTHLIKRTRR